MNVHFVKSDDMRDSIETLFHTEKANQQALLPEATIEHVGGTAVPGLLTKGDFDSCIQVTEADFQTAMDILKEHYEINQPHNWTPTYASFKDEDQDIGVQLCVQGSNDDYFVLSGFRKFWHVQERV